MQEKIVAGKYSGDDGVVYFDPEAGGSGVGEWTVVNLKGCHEPLAKSALHESQCFVFYDQSRTRGSDLKLRHDAKAVVTIAPSMNKDDMMQAVGRLRKIHFRQSVEFYGPPEVTNSITEVGRVRRWDSWGIHRA